MNPMYITFAIYLVAVLLIGLAAYFSTRNFDDYILGGRSLAVCNGHVCRCFRYVGLALDGLARRNLFKRFK